MDEYMAYIEQEQRLKKEIIPEILELLQDKKIPASLAATVPELLSKAIEWCNLELSVETDFKAYPILFWRNQ